MIAMKASEIARIVGGTFKGEEVLVTSAPVISSLDATPGSIFCAFVGENSNGHDFVTDAFAHGAVVALVSEEVKETHILVTDVLAALTMLARYVRKSLPNLSVVGITGSQGKTTTKELARSIVSSHFTTVAPLGNYNNEIGVPLTLLQCDEKTQVCIVEMGARHVGDIAHLASISEPNIGVVLKVAPAHLGEFGSIEKIAQAKSEMISSLSTEATTIIGMYDEYTINMQSLHHGPILRFGLNPDADIRAADIEMREGKAHFDLVTPDGRNTVALRIFGMHQVANALAAAAICHALGLSNDHIAAGLSMAESHAKWRMEVHELPDLLLINDAYNASPDSMAEALRTLVYFAQERGGESWAFIGTMHELGDESAALHQSIGALAAEIGIDHIVDVNEPRYASGVPEKSHTAVHHCASIEAAAEMMNHIHPGDVVLCKASRSEKFDVLAEQIEAQWLRKGEQ